MHRMHGPDTLFELFVAINPLLVVVRWGGRRNALPWESRAPRFDVDALTAMFARKEE